MNGEFGRIRRILAGLVSAMMVLTSLPLTGAAVYAAPAEAEADEGGISVAGVAEQSVVDEEAEPAEDVPCDASADESSTVNVTIKVAGPITALQLKEAAGPVSIYNATLLPSEGYTVQYPSDAGLTMVVELGGNGVMISDSVKVNGNAVSKTDKGYPLSTENGDITVEIKAYNKIGLTFYNLKDESGENDLSKFIETNGGIYSGKEEIISYEANSPGVKLEAPEAYYMEGSVKHILNMTKADDNEDIAGLYSISETDVQKAIKAGSNICINAKGSDNKNTKITITVSEDIAGVTYWECLPGDLSDPLNIKIVCTKSISQWTTVSGSGIKQAEIKLYDNDQILLQEFDYADEDLGSIDFVKATRDSRVLSEAWGGIVIDDIQNGDVVDLRTARIREDEIGLLTPNIPEGVSCNITQKFLKNYNGVNYISREGVVFTLDIRPDPDLIHDYRLVELSYAIADGFSEKIPMMPVPYAVPSQDLSRIAFATPDENGKKVNIIATVRQGATKPRTLTLVGVPGSNSDMEVVQSGTQRTIKTAENKLTADLTYGKGVTFTVRPRRGFLLDTAYIIKDTDIQSAGLDSNADDYAAKLKAAVTASQNALPSKKLKVTADGTLAKGSAAKVDGSYTILALAKEKTDLLVVQNNEELAPDKNGFYNVLWGRETSIYVAQGGSRRTISADTVHASYIDEEGSVPEGVLKLDPGTQDILSFDGEKVNGKKVKIEFREDAEDGQFHEAKFKVSPKISQNSVKFETGVLSGDEIILPMGTTAKYKISYDTDVTVPVAVETADPSDPDLVASLVDIKDKKGRITGATLTLTSAPGQTVGDKQIIFCDTTADPAEENRVIKKVTVKITTDQVTMADLSKIRATGSTDTIFFDFSEVTGFDRNTQGLYYIIDAAVSQNFIESGLIATPLANRKEHILVPVTGNTHSLSLREPGSNWDTVCNYTVPYNVTVRLVQVEETKDDGSYDETKKIAISSETKLDVTTKPDGVYATSVKLRKEHQGAIYGGKGDIGMERFLLATVDYPDAAKKLPVTVKELKKLELIDSTGTVIEGTHLYEYQNKIYLTPKGLAPGKYKVVAYAVEPMGVDVTGTMTFTVYNAINRVEISAPAGIVYKAPGKKAALNAKVILNAGKKTDAPKVKKVRWYVTRDGDPDHPYTLPAGVTFKNGKLQVKEKVILPDGGLNFTIVALPADYDHHDDCNLDAAKLPVKIQSDPLVPDAFKLNGSLLEEGMTVPFRDDDLMNGVFSVMDCNGAAIKDFTVKTTGAVKAVNKNKMKAVKCGSARITVTSADGSKMKKSISFTVGSDAGIKGELSGKGFTKEITSSEKEYEAEYKGSPGEKLTLRITGKNGGYLDHTLRLSGFRKVDEADAGYGTYYLQPTARNGKITITEKADSSHPTVINVTNASFPAAKRPTATIITAKNLVNTTYGKAAVNKKGTIYGDLIFNEKHIYEKVSYNYVTYTVKYGRTPAKEGDLVRLYTENPEIREAIEAAGASKNPADGSYTVTLGKGGTFNIHYIDDDGNFELNKGTYRIHAVPLDAATKEAKSKPAVINVKVVNTPKAKFKALATATFNDTVSEDSPVELQFTGATNIVMGNTAGSAVADDLQAGFGCGTDFSQYKDLLGYNVGGKINGFGDMFKVEDGKLVYTGEKSPFYNRRKGISGKIAVNYIAMDGSKRLTYIPITVKGNF